MLARNVQHGAVVPCVFGVAHLLQGFLHASSLMIHQVLLRLSWDPALLIMLLE